MHSAHKVNIPYVDLIAFQGIFTGIKSMPHLEIVVKD